MTAMIGFGGGCHWCTEAVFMHLIGVHKVEQGFIASQPPHDTLSEGIQLRYDEDIIPLSALIAVHLSTHSSTSDHPMRQKYRSAIYVTSDAQAQDAQGALDALQHQWSKPLVTQVLSLEQFRLNDELYHQYYLTRPDAPFCRTQIEPKLAKLRALFAPYYKSVK